MFKKIKNYAMAIALMATFSAPALVPVTVMAAGVGNDNINKALCSGTQYASGATSCTSNGDGSGTLQSVAKTIVNLLSIVVGIVAVIMIIVGGFRYITSGGESGNVSGAKNTLIYAIVGLVIVALAQFIVRFVLGQATSIGN